MVFLRLHSILLCLFAFLYPMTASAFEHRLVISSWAAPNHPVNSRMWPTFIKMLEEVSKGRVTAKVAYHLASPSDQLSLIEKGDADVGWIFHGYHPHRFLSAPLLTMPGYTTSAASLSTAYWRAQARYFNADDEYDTVTLLGLMVDGPTQLHTKQPVDKIADIGGLTIRIAGDTSHNISKELGAKGVHVPSAHINEALDEKSIDGLLMSLEARRNFSLSRKIPYVYQLDGGFFRNSYAIIMNPQALAGLPEDVRDQLTSERFGEKLSRLAGSLWDQGDAIGEAASNAIPGNRLTKASSFDNARFKHLTENERSRIIEKATRAGFNARVAVDFIEREAHLLEQAQ